ncbi:major facilitator superfamily domain-containing protein, partial [Coprinopsis sp. MPI-PUGE-AT-0042]
MTATESIDEETPLLREESRGADGKKKKITPLPVFQFGLILFLQLAEPLTSQVISPFMPQLIRDLGVTGGDETAVGYYVGLMHSIFFLTQALTVLHWSRLSDSIGRKPVILIGLSGLSISMYSFGLSKTFWGLVFSRSLNGALNGNIGVIKSMMAEMTDETNISTAYAWFPLAWSTGSSLGPIVGGSLSKPAERFPERFGNNAFLKEYPYFLACAVPATFTLFALLTTAAFLKETSSNVISIKQLWKMRFSKSNLAMQSVVGSQDPSVTQDPMAKPVDAYPAVEKPLSLKSLLTRNVVIAAGNYASISLVDIAFRSIQPVYYSTPIKLGGLGLPPPSIGNILSVYGVLNGALQVFFFAKIHDKLGSKRTFVLGMSAAIPSIAMYPIVNSVARVQGMSGLVWTLVFLQVVLSIGMSLCYGSVFIFIAAAAPNKASLGATNGLSQV